MSATTASKTEPRAFWLNNLRQDPLIARVLNSSPFRRLCHISFLGAIDYTAMVRAVPAGQRSRAEHSLGVAALANFVGSRRGYPLEQRRHLVLAALLHDIGHAPLSHSVEPYLLEKFGLGHHAMGERMLDGKHPPAKALAALLADSADTALIKRLINGEADREEGGISSAARSTLTPLTAYFAVKMPSPAR